MADADGISKGTGEPAAAPVGTGLEGACDADGDGVEDASCSGTGTSTTGVETTPEPPQPAVKPRQGAGTKPVAKKPGAKTFAVIPFRWRVERTFAWLGRWRRLSKDYEGTTSSSEAFVKLAMIHLMARRLPKVLRTR